MRIEVVTSLYPSPTRPFEGLFAERRWTLMRSRGHQVRVNHPQPLTPGPLSRGRWAAIRDSPRNEVRAGLPIERPRYLHLPGRALGNARRFAGAAWRALARGATPDVVVLDYAWPAAALVRRLRAEGIPCLVHGRGSDVLQVAADPRLRPTLVRALQEAGHWAGVSEHLVAFMDELAGCRKGRLLANGVDLEAFRILDRTQARARLRLAPEGTLVLVVGHLIERKDPLVALEVFAQGAPGDARLVFIGAGPWRALLEERARSLGLAERVRFAGELEPEVLATWYGAADVLLLTSVREGRPNVVLEALAAGRAVLATDTGGTAELLGPWKERSLAPPGNVEELARKLRALLGDPPAPAELRSSVERYSWKRCGEALEEALTEAAGGAAFAGAGARVRGAIRW